MSATRNVAESIFADTRCRDTRHVGDMWLSHVNIMRNPITINKKVGVYVMWHYNTQASVNQIHLIDSSLRKQKWVGIQKTILMRYRLRRTKTNAAASHADKPMIQVYNSPNHWACYCDTRHIVGIASNSRQLPSRWWHIIIYHAWFKNGRHPKYTDQNVMRVMGNGDKQSFVWNTKICPVHHQTINCYIIQNSPSQVQAITKRYIWKPRNIPFGG